MRRIKSSVLIRILLLITVSAGAIGLQSAGKSPFTKRDKAYYADATVINFVRPGLVFKVSSASIAKDGTITARVLVTDPQGLPLDRLGVDTPGTVSMSLIAATIPNGQKQYTSYTTRTVTAQSGGATAIQAAADSGGAFATNADGDYTYTFKTKGAHDFRSDCNAHGRRLWIAQLDDFQLRHELRLGDSELRAERRSGHGNARRDS